MTETQERQDRRLAHADSLPKELVELETEFTDWWLKDHDFTPAFADAIGWASERQTGKACEWLEKYMESLGYIDEWCRTGEDDFRKAMTEKTNPLFEQCLANVNPDTRAEVRRNMEFLDKACAWIEKHGEDYMWVDPLAIDTETEGFEGKEMAEDFRKAMGAVIKDSLTTDWHKASEELPPVDKVVIVAYDGYTEDCCFNHRSNDPEVKTSENGWCDVGYDTEPTHWMYIPEIKED